MAKFEELNVYINDVLLRLIQDQDLCKLLHYTDNDPLSRATVEDPSNLLFSKIYPIPRIPDVQTNVGSFVTAMFEDIKQGDNIEFKNSLLCFTAISHIDDWRIYGKLRPYAMMNRIDEMFNKQRVIGIGKTIFERSRLVLMNDKYSGYKMDYRITDFN